MSLSSTVSMLCDLDVEIVYDDKEREMGYILGWLLGVPFSILILIWLVSHVL